LVDVDHVIAACQKDAAKDYLAARLTVAALVQRLLQDEGLSTVVVGGTAVDVYVSGALGSSESYPAGWEESMDIDTVVLKGLFGASKDEALRVLERHGFVGTKLRAGARYPGLEIVVDLVGDGMPDDYSFDHVYEIQMEPWQELDIGPVHVTGPEDILFDYMESGWDTRHQRDWARALAVAAVMGEHLDLGYLFSKAHWRIDGMFVEPLERVLRGEPLRVG
jgi:hypothetical protein